MLLLLFVHVICNNYCKHVLQGGRTPLHDAAYNGCSRAVETLIDIGATVDIVDNVS